MSGTIAHSSLEIEGVGNYTANFNGLFDEDHRATKYPTMQWTAAAVHVDVEQSVETINSSLISPQIGLQPELDDYHAAHGEMTSRSGYAVAMAPGAQLHLTAACLDLHAQSQDTPIPFHAVSNLSRPIVPAGVAASLDCDGAPLMLHGTFLMQVWETGITVNDETGEHTLDTGRVEVQDGVAGPQARLREAYLSFTNATATYWPGSLQLPLIVVSNLAGSSSGRLHFTDYAATLSGLAVASGKELSIDGHFDLQTNLANNHLASTISGGLTAASSDDHALQLPVHQRTWLPLAWGLGGLGVVVATPYAALRVLRRQELAWIDAERPEERIEQHLARARSLLNSDHPRRARLHLYLARRLDAQDSRIHALLGAALQDSGHVRRARSSLRRAYALLQEVPGEERPKADVSYRLACCDARLRNHAEALLSLSIAVRYHPRYAGLARDEPDFSNLWATLEFEAIINGPIALT
jgi:hypothetical protein